MSSVAILVKGLDNKSVYSWNGDFTKRVGVHKSGVRKPYVFMRQSNVACTQDRKEENAVRVRHAVRKGKPPLSSLLHRH